MPHNFNIVPLPSEIVSWLTSLLLKLPVNEQYREEHTRTTLGRGNDGTSTANPRDSDTIFFSHPSLGNSRSSSSEHLPKPSETEDFREKLQQPWLSHWSSLPSVTWSRPFGATATKIQPETATDY